jgi:hypothetical protein
MPVKKKMAASIFVTAFGEKTIGRDAASDRFQVREMYRLRIDNSIYKETIVYALESACRPLKGLLLTHQEIAG